jgi:glycerophosphoryl diester phosphodiesterase
VSVTALGSLRDPSRSPRVVAHRGFAGRYPENTVAAFVAAAPEADALELDVRPTADGDPVVFHDDRLDDLTDSHGLVGATPTDSVLTAEVLDSGETVPLLRDVVAAVPADTELNVELKSPGATTRRIDSAGPLASSELDEARDRWRRFVDRVAEELDGSPHEVLYSSFCEGALAAVRERGGAPLAPLTATDSAAALDVAARYDAAAVHPAWRLVLDADAGLVDRAHASDVAVNAWTVDTWYRAARLSDAGVDGCIADYPGLVR